LLNQSRLQQSGLSVTAFWPATATTSPGLLPLAQTLAFVTASRLPLRHDQPRLLCSSPFHLATCSHPRVGSHSGPSWLRPCRSCPASSIRLPLRLLRVSWRGPSCDTRWPTTARLLLPPARRPASIASMASSVLPRAVFLGQTLSPATCSSSFSHTSSTMVSRVLAFPWSLVPHEGDGCSVLVMPLFPTAWRKAPSAGRLPVPMANIVERGCLPVGLTCRASTQQARRLPAHQPAQPATSYLLSSF